MTVTDTTVTTRVVVALARDYLTERARTARKGLDGEWRNLDVREAMLRVIERIEIEAVDGNTVTATAPTTHNGRIWAYFGGDALRHACLDGGFTVTRTDQYTYTLTITA